MVQERVPGTPVNAAVRGQADVGNNGRNRGSEDGEERRVRPQQMEHDRDVVRGLDRRIAHGSGDRIVQLRRVPHRLRRQRGEDVGRHRGAGGERPVRPISDRAVLDAGQGGIAICAGVSADSVRQNLRKDLGRAVQVVSRDQAVECERNGLRRDLSAIVMERHVREQVKCVVQPVRRNPAVRGGWDHRREPGREWCDTLTLQRVRK